jgi:hypothetical protein
VRSTFRVVALGSLVTGLVAGCGPSESEIRADVDQVCVELTDDLFELDAEPTFRQLASAADEAGFDFAVAKNRIEDIADTDEVSELADALDRANDAYDDLERQITRREYESLANTGREGEAAIAAAVDAAESIGAANCRDVGTRADYFALAAEGAQAAAVETAPTGDYVSDVTAACTRYADDTAFVFLKLNLQSLIADAVDAPPSAGDYIEMVEDLLTIGIALDVLVGEIDRLTPPADAEAAHTDLIEGLEGAIEGFRQLRTGGEVDGLIASADDVDEAAERLGVDCSVWVAIS